MRCRHFLRASKELKLHRSPTWWGEEPRFLMTLPDQTNSFRSPEMCHWFIITNAIYLLSLPPVLKEYKIILRKNLPPSAQW